jgi:predicted 3-demethylubiquinone-9 3-methyltransferase (glyoxalase superfamily)
MVVEFELEGQEFMAINGTQPATISPRPPIALFVNCETQAEVDALWDKLSDGGETLQCGWLRDKYGVTWNIVPVGLAELLTHPDPETSQRVMKAMLQMEKLDIDELRQAAVR